MYQYVTFACRELLSDYLGPGIIQVFIPLYYYYCKSLSYILVEFTLSLLHTRDVSHAFIPFLTVFFHPSPSQSNKDNNQCNRTYYKVQRFRKLHLRSYGFSMRRLMLLRCGLLWSRSSSVLGMLAGYFEAAELSR